MRNTTLHYLGRSFALTLALAAAGPLWPQEAGSQKTGPQKTGPQEDAAAPKPDGEKPAAAEEPARDIRLEFGGVPYADAIRRFGQMAGKPLLGDVKIEGSLDFSDPRPFTYDEALDTLNHILAMKGFALVETDRYLQLTPREDLPKLPLKIFRGTDATADVRPGEVVTVVLPLQHMNAAVTAEAASKMLSKAGSMTALSSGAGLCPNKQAWPA